MARSSHLNRRQALSAEQRYTHWKWRILLMFSGFYMFLYLGRFNFGFVIPQIVDDLGVSRSTIGLVNACMFWGFGLGDLVHGRLSDRFSPRLWVALGRYPHGSLQLVHQLRRLGGDVAGPLGDQWLCERHVLQPRHPPDCPLVATA